MVVLLGTPNAESSRLYAMTVTDGDPSWAGALAGISLGLPVYHITEPEVKNQVDPKVFESQIGLAEMVLDTEEIIKAMKETRGRESSPLPLEGEGWSLS